MPNFYQPDLSANRDDPFARDADNKLVRRGFWLDMGDQSLVLAMTQGVGARLTSQEIVLQYPRQGESAKFDFRLMSAEAGLHSFRRRSASRLHPAQPVWPLDRRRLVPCLEPAQGA